MRFNFVTRSFLPPELGNPGEYDVFLDGEKVTECFYADEELGEVQQYKLRDGHPYMEAGTDFAAEEEVRRGVVRIVKK